MVPGFVQESMFGFQEEEIEQFALFVLGLFGFAMFLARKYQLRRHKEEKEKEKRKLQQTAKDLVESYSYIGEINRKMDMLMQIGIGLSNHAHINKHRENEIYKSILEASNFLMKGETSLLVFFDVQEKKIKKEICLDNRCRSFNRDSETFRMEKNICIKQEKDYIIAASEKTFGNIKSYIISRTYDHFQGSDNNNQEILKYLASQALFLYSSSKKYSLSKQKQVTSRT